MASLWPEKAPGRSRVGCSETDELPGGPAVLGPGRHQSRYGTSCPAPRFTSPGAGSQPSHLVLGLGVTSVGGGAWPLPGGASLDQGLGLAWPDRHAATPSPAAEDRRLRAQAHPLHGGAGVRAPVRLLPGRGGRCCVPQGPCCHPHPLADARGTSGPRGRWEQRLQADACARLPRAAHVAVSTPTPRSTLRTVRFTLNEKRE